MRKLCISAISALLTVSMAMPCFASYGDIGIVSPVEAGEEIFFHTFDGNGSDTGNNGENVLNTSVYTTGIISLENTVFGSNCLILRGTSNAVNLGQLEEGWYTISFMHRADWQNSDETKVYSPAANFRLEADGSIVDMHEAGTLYDNLNVCMNVQKGWNDYANGYDIYCARTTKQALPVGITFKAEAGKNYVARFGIRNSDPEGKPLQLIMDDIKLTKLREASGAPIIGVPSAADLCGSSFNHTATVYNNIGYEGDALVVNAVYNQNNTCVAIDSSTVEFTGEIGEARTLKSNFNISDAEDTSTYRVKTYVWDNSSLGNPLAMAYDGYGALNKNDSFEAISGSNSFANWYSVNDAQIEPSLDSCSGVYSAKVTPGESGGGLTLGILYHLRKLYGNGTFRLSAKVKATDADAVVTLDGKYWNHQQNGDVQAISGTKVTANKNEWVTISYEFEDNTDFTTNPEFERCYLLNLTSTQSFLVDDFKLEKIN